jgi:3-deoxy-D-manno-octulosonic-acid transferase
VFSELIRAGRRREHRSYAFHAYRALPVTFVRRIMFGRDPYWKRYFWSRWGYGPADVRAALGGRPVVWLDALSGGEVTQMVTFCRRLRAALPGHALLLVTNNRYSFDFATKMLDVDVVMDAPWDLRGPARRALAAVDPVAVVGTENLTAPMLFAEARRRGIPTVIVSGIMSKDIHRHPIMSRSMEWAPFGGVDHIGAKSEEDVRGYVGQGARVDRVQVTGNMKFDLEYLEVAPDARAALREDMGLGPEERIVLAASIHPREDAFVAEAFLAARARVPGLRLVVVPRNAFEAAPMTATFEGFGLSVVRRTSRKRPAADDVLLVDTFGELGRLYSIAAATFIGGSTYKRNVIGFGQNIVEPLVQGAPIFFGKFMNGWREITDALVKEWPGLEVATAADLGVGLVATLTEPTLDARLRERARSIVEEHRDDVRRNVELVARVVASTGEKR